MNQGRTKGEGLLTANYLKSPPPVLLLLAVPKRLFCFGSLVILDVVCRYLSLFLLYINIEIGKKYMFNVRLAGDHLLWEIAVHLAVAGDVFNGISLCCPFSHEMS